MTQAIKTQNSAMKLLLVMIGVLLLISLKRCVEAEDKISSLKKENDFLTIESRQWHDMLNNSHSTVEVLKLEKEELENLTQKQAKELSIKPKQIIRFVKSDISIGMETKLLRDTTRDSISYSDSSYIGHYVFKDKWMNIQTDVHKDYTDFKMSGSDSFALTQYWKRKNFLSKKQTFVDIRNMNPYIYFSNTKAIELTDKTPIIIVGPAIGVGYNKGIVPFIGVSLLYYPLTFKIFK